MGSEQGDQDRGPLSAQERARVVREALLGKTIADRYVLRAVVGHGGMGAVYEAEHLGLGKRVAIKFVDPEFATDERVLARFAREARVMSSIESAHIVSVFDAGTESGRPYLVMELLRGEDLGQRLRRLKRVPLGDAMHIVAQVLKGLAKAHAAGIVHRDLKPDNVFLVKSDTDPLFAKIVDFGISKIERPRDRTSPLALTGRGTVLGTPFYMCPEQAQAASDVDSRADLYSVGAILFECLSGRPPHTGETYEQIILSICMRDAPNLRAIEPTITPEVASFVERALARDRAQRYSSAERMLAALHEIAPQEKLRVPLDFGSPQTLLSAGVALPTPDPPDPNARPTTPDAPGGVGVGGVATRLVGALPSPADDAPSARAIPNAPPVPISPRLVSRPAIGALATAAAVPSAWPARSTTAIVLTATLATLTGVGVMLALVGAMAKKPPSAKNAGEATAMPSATASSSSSVRTAEAPTPTPSTMLPAAPTPTPMPAPLPVSTSTTTPPVSPKPHNGAPTAKPTSTRLDISRDLP